MPLWYAKKVTPATEFERYRAYESIALNQKEKPDYYAAGIIQAVLATKGVDATIESCLINFQHAIPKTEKEFEEDQIAIWEAATGKKAKRA